MSVRVVVSVATFCQLVLAVWFVTSTAPGTDAAWRGLPLDDAWIHLVYGRGFLDGAGPWYNPGQLETGFTSPLQALVAAVAVGVSRTGPPVAVVLKALGVLVAAPMPTLAARVAERRGGPVAAGIAAVGVALSPTLAFAQVSGMEVSLAATLLLATVDAADRGGRAGAWWALAILARPEALCFAPWVVGRCGPRALVAPGAAVAAWVGVDLAITGHPLPATFYGKSMPWAWQRIPVFGQALAGSWAWAAWGVGLVPWAVGTGGALRRSLREGMLLVLPVAFVVAVGGGRAVSPSPDVYYFLRYFLPVEPLFVVTTALGLATLVQRPVVWLLAVPWALFTAAALPARRDLYAWNCQNIEELNGAVARWLHDHADPSDGVLTCDAGYVAYASGLRTRDIVGLNDHELLFDRPTRVTLSNDPEGLAAWMDTHGVRWVVVFPKVFPFTDPDRHPERWLRVADVAHAEHYTLVPGPQDTLVVIGRAPTAP